jgi:hypothetical protein
MAPGADRGWVLDVGTQRAVACCLVVALLTSACAVSGPRATPPETVRAADREACEGLAGKTEALIQGGSVWAGVAMGAAVGPLVVAAALARGGSFSGDEGDAAIAGVVLGALGAVGGLIGATVVVAKNAGVRKAAYAEAMDACLRPVLLTRELGPEHPELARSLHALAYRYHRQAEFAKAEPLYARALAIQERSLGTDAPEVATILDDYATLLRQTGRVVEAGELERRAAAIRAKQ